MTEHQQLLRAIIFGRPPASNVEARGPALCFRCGGRAVAVQGRDAVCALHISDPRSKS